MGSFRCHHVSASTMESEVAWKYSGRVRASPAAVDALPSLRRDPPMVEVHGRPLPATVEELYSVLPSAAARVFGHPLALATVGTSDALTSEFSGIECLYLPQEGGHLLVSPAAAARLSQFLAGDWTSHRLNKETSERWPLTMVVSTMASLTHALAHASVATVGETDVDGWWETPAAFAWEEGLAELCSREFTRPLMDELGMMPRDPRLGELSSISGSYPLPTEAVTVVLDRLAAAEGVDRSTQLRHVVASGLGPTSMWHVAAQLGRVMGQSADPNADLGISPVRALSPVLAALEETFASVTSAWVTVQDDDLRGYGQELERGAQMGAKAVGTAQISLQRLAAALKGIPDLGVLGRGISDAAQAASSTLENQLGDVWAALDSMAAMGGS